ncbi:MAG: DUF5695 domain-containing protein [[Clostridium] leptum]
MIGGLRKKIALGLACCMLLGTIPVNASAAKTAGDVPPVQSDAKNASAVEEAKEGDLLYFVDAGDFDTSTVPEGESLGLLNSRTDQFYSVDDKAGYSWGLVSLDNEQDDKKQAVGEKGKVETTHQGSNNTYDSTKGYQNWADGTETGIDVGAISLRFAKDQNGKYGRPQVRYDFEVPAGAYEVEVGFSNSWGNAGNVEVLVNDQSIGTAQIANLSTGVVKGVVKAEEASKLVVNSQSADSTVQVCYIKIYKGEGTDPVPPKPTFDPAVVDNAQVGDLLYFVDAGDYNTSTVADGEKLGILNSKTDQLYGTDDKEGYGWGLVSLDNEKHDTLLETGPEGQVLTNHQYSNNNKDLDRGYENWETGLSGILDYMVSLRFARDQGGIFDPRQIRYQFDVPDGYYEVEVGYSNTWNNANNVEAKVNGKSIGTANIGNESTAVIKGTVRVPENETQLTVDCLSYSSTLQVCYIKVYKADDSNYEENEWTTESGVKFEKLPDGAYKMTNDYFEVKIGQYGQIEELYLVNDEYKTNYVLNGQNFPYLAQSPTHQWMGELMFSIKKGQEEQYSEYYTSRSDNGRTISIDGDKIVVTYENATGDKAISGFKVVETYQYVDEQLHWEVTVENTGSENMIVGDWGMPMPFNELLTGGPDDVYEKRAIDHSFVGLDSSYIYATRPNGDGHFLVFTPDASTGAKLEYNDRWTAERSEEENNWKASGTWASGLNVYYIHSDYIKKTHSGYLSNSSLEIPAGQSKTYAFNFTGVKDEEDMRSTLYEEDLVDMVAVPGFAYSVDMPGKIYLHTTASKDDITIDIQCPHETNLHNYGSSSNIHSTMEHTKTNENTYAKYLETKTVDGEQYHIYELKFTEFGQHNLIVNYKQDGEAKQAVSQFYLMDSVDNMLNDHAEFMVEETQLDRPGKVGHMLFDEWWMNIKGNRIETFGEDGDGYFQMNYWGWGDDWGATHAQFLAEMNAISPNKDQVEALDAYLDVAIWNELMREHQKDYRVHNFLMEAPNTSPDGRGYAYPHIYNTFFSMYKIASTYPELTDYREDAVTYLLRAYNIFCTQNSGSVGYGVNCGTMGESSVPDIIEALEKEGLYDEADKMLQIMENNKYNAFETSKYPYGSEYSYDNTAEEGVFVAAMLAQEYGFEAVGQMTPEERIKALDSKTRACRGMQPLWYFYANPVTICGESWWNFQYTCALAAVPMDNWLRLQDNGMTQEEKGVAERVNYAAKLGNLTSVNSGQINSDPDTIGTVAWIYQSEMGDYAEAGDTLYNGWRHRAGESGLGLWGALRILSADVATDPVFGLFGYGCEVSDNGSAYEVTPLDGVQQRLHLIDEEIYIELNRDQYTKAVVNKDGTGFTLTVDSNGTGEKHDLELEVYGLAAGSYQIQSGNYTGTFTAAEGETEKVVVPVTGNGSEITVTKTTAAGGLTVEIEEPAESVVSDTVKLYGKAVVGGAQIIGADKYEWTVQESGAAIEDADKAVAKLNVTEAGVYHVTLKATVGGETKEKTVTVTVKDDPAMKELVAQFTFEDDTIEGKDETGANIANNATVNSVGDTMGHTALASNFQRMEEGEDGKAARFTGDIKGGYLEMTEDAFKRLESATISMDICLEAEQAINATLMDLGGQILLYFGEDGALHLQAGEAESVSTNISMAPEFWKNVTLVADGDNYILYVDGKECASVRGTGVFLNQLGSSKRYLFGRSQVENGAFYNGLMDNLTIRSRALSADEVEDLSPAGEHKPLSADKIVLATTVGAAPSLPAQIDVLYTDGVYEMTNVTWEAVDPEMYSKEGLFVVKGLVNGEIEVKAEVLVVSGEKIQLEQLPNTDADSIMGDRSTWLGPDSLIWRQDPVRSDEWVGAPDERGAWQNWGDASQNTNAWVAYYWDSPKILTESDAFFAIDGNQNFFPKTYELEYRDEAGVWHPVENTTEYVVVKDGFSNLKFNPVVATGIRLTMTPSKDGSAIMKWKVYGWESNATPPQDVPVTGVALNKDELLFTEAGASETLIAEIAPHNATNINVSWSSDRPEVATVDENGKVTAVANGTAAITVTTEDGNKTDSCVVTVEIPEPGHVHDDPLKKVEEKPATCTQEGNKAYYVCESCGTWFEDAAGEKPITDHDSVILPKTEHTPSDWKADADNHWKECTECTETIAGSLSAHSFEWIIDREATATEDGSKHEECSVCGYAKEPVRIPATGTGPVDPEDPATSEIVVETDAGQVRINTNGIDLQRIANALGIDLSKTDTKLVIKQNDQIAPGAIEYLKQQIAKANQEFLNVFDVSMCLYAEGKEPVEIADDFGSMTISLAAGKDYAGKLVTVYQLTEKGEVVAYKDLKVDENGMATITVTELSSFAIALQKNVNGGDTGNPEQGGDAPAQTGDSRNIWIWVIALAAALCGAAGLGLYARKKARNSQ